MRVTRLTLNRNRRLGLAAASVASVALLSGCGQMTNEFTTDLHYDAADGVSAKIGNLNAENLLIVSDGKSAQGKLEGLVYNPGNNDAQATFTLGKNSKTITVPAGESVRLDDKANGNDTAKAGPIKLPSLDGAKPGDQVSVTVKSGSSASSVEVPVLLNQHPYGDASPTHAEDPEPSETLDVGIDHSSSPEH